MGDSHRPGSRKIYLTSIPWEEARDRYLLALEALGSLRPGPPEIVAVPAALGRITARPVYARYSSPHYPACAMDGVAVASRLTFGARETAPVRLRLGEEAIEVDTGDRLPVGCDAVIMAEDLQYLNADGHPILGPGSPEAGPGLGLGPEPGAEFDLGSGRGPGTDLGAGPRPDGGASPEPIYVETRKPAAPWQHVRSIGEDMVAGEMLLPANWRLRAYDLGALLASGVTQVAVYPRPLVTIIPTGTELVVAGEEPPEGPEPGQILESNGAMLAALIEEWGGRPQRSAPVADDYQELEKQILAAAKRGDLVLVNAGSSAGREDFTAAIIAQWGEVYVHGVATRPGKPVILGRIGDTPVIGIPGYSVSAALAAELFVAPLVSRLLGVNRPSRPLAAATITRKVASAVGAEEFLRVKLGRVGEKLIATPLARGAGVLTSLVRADGVVRVPRLSQGLAAGEKVQVELLRPVSEVEGTIVAIGSHDLCLDVLGSHLHQRYPDYFLSSANVGSLAGLVALSRGEAHLAGTHLLDPETGEYNVSYVRRYLKDRTSLLVNLVYRQQGLMVPKGNPKGIQGVADLAREDVMFINRQRGAGTRVLLDFLLQQQGIQPGRINGYGREEYTHLAVAAAVAGGTADAAMGILAAAQTLGLDFVPIAEERYDLCIPEAYMELDPIARLLEVAAGEGFRREVEGLGGYDTRDGGKIMARVEPGASNPGMGNVSEASN